MKISLVCIGKTEEKYLTEGIRIFSERINHYNSFQIIEIPELKKTKGWQGTRFKEEEFKLLEKHFQQADYIILLDENGTEHSSVSFSGYLQKRMNSGIRHLMFVVGGAYGFSEKSYQASHDKISLSKMTFSHQMVRLFFTEQLYRAFTIIRNEPYHNP